MTYLSIVAMNRPEHEGCLGLSIDHANPGGCAAEPWLLAR